MVMQFFPPQSPVIKENLSLAFIGLMFPNNMSGSTITVPSVAIGSPSPSRIVVLTINYQRTGGVNTFNSVTVGGVQASIIQNHGTNVGLCMAWAAIPSGTAVEVSVSFVASVSADRFRFGVYSIKGASAEPFSSGLSTAGGEASRTVSLNTPQNGIVIVAANGTNTSAITGVSMDYSYTGPGTEVGKAGSSYPSLSGTPSIFTTTTRAMIAASWR